MSGRQAMRPSDYGVRVEEVKRRAHGRWTEILASLGVDEGILKRKNMPCPACGGTDRFQYTDKFGEGNYHCRHCGAGGGFKLLQAVKGIDFNTALQAVAACVDSGAAVRRESITRPSDGRMMALAKRIWDEAVPVERDSEVDLYLQRRRLRLLSYPTTLRQHPALGFYEKDASGKSCKIAEYPAMLACIQGPDGHAVALHRTYLQDGRKAAVAEAKKVLSSGINGAAVRLFEPTDELAVAEGIETALAVHLATDKPVWAGLSAGNLERLWLPETVRRVFVYADNDANRHFDGQAFAFALARRLKKEEGRTGAREVQVFVPSEPGMDWADVWFAQPRATRRSR